MNPEYEKHLRIGGAPELANSPDGLAARHRKGHPTSLPEKCQTLGFRPSCNCNAGEPVPAVVLDPFMGAATTAVVAEQLGRNWLGIEINPEYVAMAEKRLAEEGTLI